MTRTYFGARYYGSGMGRFLSPDPLGNAVADLTNPQSWNQYSYALDNPLKYIDPTGADYCVGAESAGDDDDFNSDGCENDGGSWITSAAGTISVTVTASANSGSDDWDWNWPFGSGSPAAPDPSQPQQPGAPQAPGILQKIGNIFKKAYQSTVTPGGCDNLLFTTFASDLSPVPLGNPSPTDAVQPTANFLSALSFNKALAYAASQPNALGGTGLLYPFKSSVFRNLINVSDKLLEYAPAASILVSATDALATSIGAAYNGTCH